MESILTVMEKKWIIKQEQLFGEMLAQMLSMHFFNYCIKELKLYQQISLAFLSHSMGIFQIIIFLWPIFLPKQNRFKKGPSIKISIIHIELLKGISLPTLYY